MLLTITKIPLLKLLLRLWVDQEELIGVVVLITKIVGPFFPVARIKVVLGAKK